MINIQIYYNGGFPHAHTVSREFLSRLYAWLAKHPKADIVIVELS